MTHGLVEPGDDARAAKSVTDVVQGFAVRFDPVDRITFYSELIRRLALIKTELETQMRADD